MRSSAGRHERIVEARCDSHRVPPHVLREVLDACCRSWTSLCDFAVKRFNSSQAIVAVCFLQHILASPSASFSSQRFVRQQPI